MGNQGLACCTHDSTNGNTDYQVPQGDKDSSPVKAIALPNPPKIPSFTNVSSIFEFILSDQYYLLLLGKISQFDIILKITSSLNETDLVVLFSKLVDWIHICDSKNNSLIKRTKIEIDIGTKNLICQLNGRKDSNKVFRINMSQSIGEISMIAQYIKYISEHKKNNQNYNENYWKEKDIENYLRMTVYKCIYYLVQAKINASGELEEVERAVKMMNGFLERIVKACVNNK